MLTLILLGVTIVAVLIAIGAAATAHDANATALARRMIMIGAARMVRDAADAIQAMLDEHTDCRDQPTLIARALQSNLSALRLLDPESADLKADNEARDKRAAARDAWNAEWQARGGDPDE